MIETDNYIRYERVDAVHDTATGVEAELHRERLRIDVVRDDVVRVKISRGGEFDETPTYAVCVDPLAEVPDFTVVRDDDRVRVSTAACTVSLWLDPFRIDVHRADGTPVVETAADDGGPLLGVRHLERRLHAAPDVPPGGRDLRAGREVRPAQPQGPRLHAVEHRRAQPVGDAGVHRREGAGRPAGRPALGRVRPVLRQHPVLLPPGLPGRADGRVIPGQRLPRQLRVLRERGVPDPLPRRAVHRVHLRRAARCRPS